MSAPEASQENAPKQIERRTARRDPLQPEGERASAEPGSIHVTIFASAKAVEPMAAEDLTWPGFVAELEGALASTAPEKTALLAFGPYRLRDGATRGDANVVERTLIALDSDDGTPPETYVGRLRDLGVAAFVYGTPGDSPAKRKCRIVVPLTAPLEPDAGRVAMTALAEQLRMAPGCGVERTLDPSRIYFVGRLEGTPERERWILEGEPLDPSTLLPPVHAWSAAAPNGHRKGEASSADEDSTERARILAEILPASVAGHGGNAALFRAAREIATVVGPDVAAVRRALEIFNARCLPPWDGKILDREAQRAAADQDSLSARTLRRVTSHGPLAAPAEAAPEALEAAVILTTPLSRNAFVYDPRIEAHVEIAPQNLIAFLRTSGAERLVETHGPKGGDLSPQTIIARNATVVKDAIADFRSPAPCLYDRQAKRLLLGIMCPVIEARLDERVGLWLDALAGDEIAAVTQWIASTRQDRIHRLATALCLVGPHGAGKTVFAYVCAHLWGAPPVELANVAAQFNAAQAGCPIVLDDECKCLAKKTLTTEEFRVLVQARERLYEPKGKERRPLLGAQRFILTANDVTDLRFANALGHGALDALAERVTPVIIDDEQAELAREALDAVRLPGGDLDWPALTGHFAALRDAAILPDERVRFLGQPSDRARARRAIVAHAIDADQALYDRIVEVATGAAASGPIFVEVGSLWVRVGAIAEILHVATGAERWDVARVTRALETIRGKRDQVWHDGENVRAREIDVGRLVEFCRLDAEAVRRTLRGEVPPPHPR